MRNKVKVEHVCISIDLPAVDNARLTENEKAKSFAQTEIFFTKYVCEFVSLHSQMMFLNLRKHSCLWEEKQLHSGCG